MENYVGSFSTPWYTYRYDIKSLSLQGITSIGDNAFSRLSITGIMIPGSVTKIGNNAFGYCSGATSLTIGGSVETIGELAFTACSDLKGTLTIPNSVTTIGSAAFGNCSGFTGTLNIPNSVTSIGSDAFSRCSGFSSVVIPTSITTIVAWTFSECHGLTSVNIPHSVTSIGNSAFENCSGLASVTIPNSVKSIGERAFYDCDELLSITIPTSVTSIGEKAFQLCNKLTMVTIPHSVTSIGISIFGRCSGLTSIHVDAGNSNYSSVAGVLFSKSQDTLWQYPGGKTGSYSIPNSVTIIGDYAFYDCTNLTSVTIPSSVTTIAKNAFMACSGLTGTFTIPDSVRTIGESAFSGCDGLNALIIENSVRSIAKNAFAACRNLTDIRVKWTTASAIPSVTGKDVFYGLTLSNVTLHVPAGTKAIYEATAIWKDFNIEEQEGTTFHVTISANDAAMGTVTGDGDYEENTTATIEAIPNTGYRFVQWNDGNTQNPRTITVTEDISFTATFEAIVYTVSLSSNDDSRGTITGSGTYLQNSLATLIATPNAGYRFVSWTDNNKDSMRTITVTGNVSLVALFGREDMYYIYAVSNNPSMGVVTGTDDYHKNTGNSPVFKREYAANSIASLTATANTGYRFVQWNDANTDNPREFTVTGDSIFTAIFEANVGIADKEIPTISIYPNPATDHINIVLPEEAMQAVFTLYDMQGKTLIKQEVNNQDAIKVSNLASGVYIYHIKTETQNYTSKLIRK
jgi:hypothetical protein